LALVSRSLAGNDTCLRVHAGRCVSGLLCSIFRERCFCGIVSRERIPMSTSLNYGAHRKIDGYLEKGEIHKAFEVISTLPKVERLVQFQKVLVRLKSCQKSPEWFDWRENRLHVLVVGLVEIGELKIAEEAWDQMSGNDERKKRARILIDQAVALSIDASRGAYRMDES